MRVLIYEPEYTGHHLADLARVIPAVVRCADEVVWATTPEALRSSAYAKMFPSPPAGVRIETCCVDPAAHARKNLVWLHLSRLRECSRLARRFGADHVYIMMGDGKWQIAAGLGFLGWRPFARHVTSDTFLIRGEFAYPEAASWGNRLKRFLFRRVMRRGPFTSLLLLDEILAARSEEWVGPGDRAVVRLSPAPMVPQPGLSAGEAREKAGLPAEEKILLMLGMIQPLRGAERVLRAYAAYREKTTQKPAVLVLAGPHDPRVNRVLETEPFRRLREQGAILCQDEYLNDRQMYTFAAACDVMTVGTHRHAGRSSALVWAAANGKPVVTTDTGSIGWVVESTPLGWTCDVTDENAFSDALLEALNDSGQAIDPAVLREYAGFHHIDHYREVATRCLRNRAEDASDEAG